MESNASQHHSIDHWQQDTAIIGRRASNGTGEYIKGHDSSSTKETRTLRLPMPSALPFFPEGVGLDARNQRFISDQKLL